MKKVLHIANWYPNKWDNLDAIFIQEQFKVFSKITNTHLLNIQVRYSKTLFRYKYIKYSDNEEGYYIFTSIKSSKVIELLTTFLLLWGLIKSNYKKYDFLHFHIAYPLLVYYYIWKRFIKIPIIISEHWSIYHFNFYMPPDTKKLDRVKNIFKQNIPLLPVSRTLLNSIENFIGTKIEQSFIIPNVINQKIFYYQNNYIVNDIPIFFIVNTWSPTKNPFPMLKAFAKLSSKEIPFKLKIGGYGDYFQKIKEFIDKYNLSNNITLFGKMKKEEIAYELNKADAYLFSSNYETFSIICAEALSCGCPLIGTKLSAILEYTNKDEIVIVNKNNPIEWENQILYFIKNREFFNREKIAKKAKKQFSNQYILDIYRGIIK